MNEYYCPLKKPRWEHDKECYYHGEDATCPYCGTNTIEVMEGTYTPIGGYTQMEVEQSIYDTDVSNYGGPINLAGEHKPEGYSRLPLDEEGNVPPKIKPGSSRYAIYN